MHPSRNFTTPSLTAKLFWPSAPVEARRCLRRADFRADYAARPNRSAGPKAPPDTGRAPRTTGHISKGRTLPQPPGGHGTITLVNEEVEIELFSDDSFIAQLKEKYDAFFRHAFR